MISKTITCYLLYFYSFVLLFNTRENFIDPENIDGGNPPSPILVGVSRGGTPHFHYD